MKFRYLKKEKIGQVPKAPGVYALSSEKEILYIGKAGNLRDRVKNHFHKSSYRDNLFIDKVQRIGWIETQSDIDALLLESKLIKKKNPRYNVMWKDDKGYFYVGITREQFPRVFLTHQPSLETQNVKRETKTQASDLKFQVSRYIGPFVDGKAIKQVLRLLRRVFPYYTLRRGSGQAAKKHPALPCPWCHLDLCPGPKPNPKEYRRNIKNLVAVLQGKRKSVLKNLQKEMASAAQKQRFESAARLRDQLIPLQRIVSHSFREKMPRSPETSKELQSLFRAKKPVKRVEGYDISNIQGKFATGSMVTFLKGKPAKEWYRKFKIHITGKPNDFAMMEEMLSRRLRHAEWPYPDLMVIDGGKGQLSSALKATANLARLSYPQLSRAKLQNIKVVALAKRNNELFFPGRSQPLLLKNLPQEASNLLLHIRDEAHRFAITYHRKLRRIDAFSEK